MNEPTVSDGTQTSGSRVLWGDQGPAYAEGWRDCAFSLAASFGGHGNCAFAATPVEAARLAWTGAAEMARRAAQERP